MPGLLATPWITEWGPPEHPLERIVQPHDADLYASAGLAVVAWGITAYECLYARTPTLIIPQNTARQADALRAEQATGGALRVLRCVEEYSPAQFLEVLIDLWTHPAKRQHMHDAGFRLLDDAGAERIATIILKLFQEKQ